MASATATAGSMALQRNRGAHPTTRLDSFLKSTDVVFQHGEAPQQGDRFVRKMATYGQVRPSVSFTNESRAQKPFKEQHAVDMSSLANPALDPKGDPRQGTLEIPLPPADIDSSFVKMRDNHSLMLPSERYAEHLAMKAGAEKFKQDNEAARLYKKRLLVLERHYPHGVQGIDGPHYPGTNLYAQRQDQLHHQADRQGRHADGRHDHLHHQGQSNDAVSMRNYAEPHNLRRSEDICIQRKNVDPEKHPFRYLNTHERLFPSHVPTWDPHRAAHLRSHDVREKSHCHLTGKDNSLRFRVAPRWDEDVPQKTVWHVGDAGRPSSLNPADPLSRSCPNV